MIVTVVINMVDSMLVEGAVRSSARDARESFLMKGTGSMVLLLLLMVLSGEEEFRKNDEQYEHENFFFFLLGVLRDGNN